MAAIKLVLVEDEEILRVVLKEKFEEAGFEMSVAVDGEEAVPLIQEINPKVVILDLLLPKKNGFDVLQELKADSSLKNIPVIILSNLGQDEEIKRALQLGAADYFVKTQHPIKEVVEKIKAYAEKQK